MSDPLRLQPGDTLADRYRIEGHLGTGGHAYVYMGRQHGIERKVAIKILKGSKEIDPARLETLRKRFEQEARLIAQLKDPHTITLYDYGTTEQGHLYMASEFVDGESLKAIQKREGAFPAPRVIRILKQLLLSLQEAHALGVLHRDIKPDNIMIHSHLGQRDCVKLLDFGIAKLLGGGDKDLTREGSVIGTPRYISPERLTSSSLGPPSDLYSLGIVAHEMLTGARVYAELKGIEVLRAQLHADSLTLPCSLHVPQGLRVIVDKLSRKELADRYALASDVLRDIAHLEATLSPCASHRADQPEAPAVVPSLTTLASHLLAFALGGMVTALLFLLLTRFG